ncbi:MAG: hypothetical protein K8I29_12045 [Alphaproteobacteria bacterium]|uniref:Uncharacterized protein n=1 Tax=Candidatus Nitrobium versatile TaxID=2884831 RepID=A0A953JE72_9BACT|nr:hypothetical protein [Candidatus Nitrobium versatile]
MRSTEIGVFIFLLGLLGLNWPFLEIFRLHVGAYLAVFWIVFIVLVAVASRYSGGRSGPNIGG